MSVAKMRIGPSDLEVMLERGLVDYEPLIR
jgi:hypothetical protein